jgi:hypothetical protein
MSVDNLSDADVHPNGADETHSRSSRRRSRPHRHGNTGSRLLIGHFEAGQIGEDAESDENNDLDMVFDRRRLVRALKAVAQRPSESLAAGLTE